MGGRIQKMTRIAIITENVSFSVYDPPCLVTIEVIRMNLCFQMLGIDAHINLRKKDISLLCEDRLDSKTILLKLSNNYTYL